MKKKLVLVMVLAAFIAGGAFAQFGIEIYTQVDGDSITPTIGFDINLGGIDILAGVSFNSSTDSRKDDDRKDGLWGLDIYAGLGPKVFADRWAVSFPLLVQFGFGGTTYKPSSGTVYQGTNAGGSFDIGFRAGAKAEYAITRNISIFTGVLLNVITYSEKNRLHWNGPTYGGGTNKNPHPNTYVYIFDSGRILFGAKINF